MYKIRYSFHVCIALQTCSSFHIFYIVLFPLLYVQLLLWIIITTSTFQWHLNFQLVRNKRPPPYWNICWQSAIPCNAYINLTCHVLHKRHIIFMSCLPLSFVSKFAESKISFQQLHAEVKPRCGTIYKVPCLSSLLAFPYIMFKLKTTSCFLIVRRACQSPAVFPS